MTEVETNYLKLFVAIHVFCTVFLIKVIIIHSKYFPVCVWLKPHTYIVIHHNQLLFTKFGRNLRHIESMMSKVQPTADYWTDDAKMMSKVQPAADYWTVDRKNLEIVLFLLSRNTREQKRNGETPSRTGKYFKWIIKQLLNSAFGGYEEFCRSWRYHSYPQWPKA